MSNPLKVFVMNWNGKVERMVAAKSKKAARGALGVSEYRSRDVLHETWSKRDVEVAMGHPGAVFEKPYNPGNSEWTQLMRDSREKDKTMTPYLIEKITADNRRPGMKHPEGHLVRYRPHDAFGWTGSHVRGPGESRGIRGDTHSSWRLARSMNPRYLEYCRVHGKTSEEMMDFDKARYPGGCMCGYVLWIRETRLAFMDLHNIPDDRFSMAQTRLWDEYLMSLPVISERKPL